MDTKALRQKILDLAIRGKLVPQDPSDEPASVLLERIRAEKQKMVKEGKLKAKDIKNDSIIYVGEDNLHYEKFADGSVKCIEKEIPFDLPEGWAWARLKDIGKWKSGATPSRKCLEYYDGDIPWVKTGDLNDDYIRDVPEKISEKALKETSVSLIPGDTVLIAMYGATIGKLGITTCDVTTNQACCACCSLNGLSRDFLFYFLMQYKSEFVAMGVGGAQPNISKEKIVQVIVPIPPIEEQNRITAQISKLFACIEAIENDNSNLRFAIHQAKSKILDLAIRGKLVPQDPNDEPASVLLERIREEKEELIKAGKLKRDKKESVIFRGEDNSYYEKIGEEVRCIDQEISYEIPKTWTWVRLANCCCKEIKRGKSPKYAKLSNTLVFAQKCNRKYSGIDVTLAQYLDENMLSKYDAYEYIQDKDIVVNSTGTGTLGRVGLYRTSANYTGLPIVPDSHITVIRACHSIHALYLYIFMKANQAWLEKKGEGSTNQKELKPITLKDMLVPIPPYSTQKRIVTTVEKAFSSIASVEESLN